MFSLSSFYLKKRKPLILNDPVPSPGQSDLSYEDDEEEEEHVHASLAKAGHVGHRAGHVGHHGGHGSCDAESSEEEEEVTKEGIPLPRSVHSHMSGSFIY